MITYFHRNIKAGYSINKVTQAFVRHIIDKEEYYVPYRRANIFDILKNLWFVYKHRNKKGVNHITGDIHYCILALLGCSSVLTIHDTVSLDFAKGSTLKKTIIKWLWYKLPIKYATKVVCISEETKRKIQPLTKRNDIIVIPDAIDPSFITSLKDQSRVPYDILHIGTKSNKNLERTIQALEKFECKLTIIGRLTSSQISLLENSKLNYCVKSDLTDEELMNEYVYCDIVSFISLFEGFGMPIIEANKIGRPVITSTIPVVREVAGDSAVFVDPYDVNQIENGFSSLFNDQQIRKDCVEKGLKNVTRFDSLVISSQYSQLYNQLRKKV